MTEHHSIPGVSSSSPAVLLARLSAHTTCGSAGGVMLPPSPLIVAEQYGLLQALGRAGSTSVWAPGTNQAPIAREEMDS